MSILKVQNVVYSYDKRNSGKQILKDVSCSFETGRFYAIIGKSGSGKSTLLSLMAGLDLPDSGQILFEDTPTSKMDLDEYRRIHAAVVYQDFCLFPLLTVLENIMYPMELCRVSRNQAFADARALARKVALPDKLYDSYPGQISGGEQQRVAIARALAMDRRLILADEPTGNLDSENSDGILNLLLALAHEENRCVIVVTHDLGVMEKADTVLHIIDGRLEIYNHNGGAL